MGPHDEHRGWLTASTCLWGWGVIIALGEPFISRFSRQSVKWPTSAIQIKHPNKPLTLFWANIAESSAGARCKHQLCANNNHRPDLKVRCPSALAGPPPLSSNYGSRPSELPGARQDISKPFSFHPQKETSYLTANLFFGILQTGMKKIPWVQESVVRNLEQTKSFDQMQTPVNHFKRLSNIVKGIVVPDKPLN